MRHIVSRICCTPPYLKSTFYKDKNLALCSPKQLKRFSKDLDFHFKNTGKLSGPCRDFFALLQRYSERKNGKIERNETHDLAAKIELTFLTDEFKYISELQAYPAWSFMAEVGGYAGLFLGFSILHFPDIIEYTLKYITEKKRWI